jgi:hypothetical protein
MDLRRGDSQTDHWDWAESNRRKLEPLRNFDLASKKS